MHKFPWISENLLNLKKCFSLCNEYQLKLQHLSQKEFMVHRIVSRYQDVNNHHL